jgi:hypothetical protein
MIDGSAGVSGEGALGRDDPPPWGRDIVYSVFIREITERPREMHGAAGRFDLAKFLILFDAF